METAAALCSVVDHTLTTQPVTAQTASSSLSRAAASLSGTIVERYGAATSSLALCLGHLAAAAFSWTLMSQGRGNWSQAAGTITQIMPGNISRWQFTLTRKQFWTIRGERVFLMRFCLLHTHCYLRYQVGPVWPTSALKNDNANDKWQAHLPLL